MSTRNEHGWFSQDVAREFAKRAGKGIEMEAKRENAQGTEGQDRKSYSDTQDRESYKPAQATAGHTPHTPGPWKYGSQDSEWVVYSEHADQYALDGAICRIDDSEVAANDARLIAAAPKLLEALEAIYNCGSIKEAERLAEAALKLARQGE
jgi:hypothetical protein